MVKNIKKHIATENPLKTGVSSYINLKNINIDWYNPAFFSLLTAFHLYCLVNLRMWTFLRPGCRAAFAYERGLWHKNDPQKVV